MKVLNNYLLTGEESERLTYRLLAKNDMQEWLKFCAYPDSLKYIFDPKDLDKTPEEKCKLWFDKVFWRYENNKGGMNALIDKETGALAGQCGLLIQVVDGIEELEIGYSLMPAFRGKGYALEAAQKCKDFAFKNNFRDSLISIINEGNTASENVALKNGMHIDKNTLFSDTRVNIFRINKS